MITTKKEIREAFWEAHPSFDEQAPASGIRSKPQNCQCATIRCAFVDFVDYLHRSGDISDKLAQRATL